MIADRLLSLGADVRAADPHVVEDQVNRRVVRVDPTPEELSAADAVVLWPTTTPSTSTRWRRTPAWCSTPGTRVRADANVEYL